MPPTIAYWRGLLIYLLSLLEAFGKEYIADRDNVYMEDISSHISPEKSAWQQKEAGYRASTSFYNTVFLAFTLTEKYGVEFGNDISSCFWEIGPLRSCIVHHQSVVAGEVFRSSLKNVIATTNTIDAVGEQIMINDKLVWVLIEDTRALLRACGS